MGDNDEECIPMYHHQHELPRFLEDGVTVTKLTRRWLPSMGNESSVPHREKYKDIYCILSRKEGTITYLCIICAKSIKEAYSGMSMPFSNMMKHLRAIHCVAF